MVDHHWATETLVDASVEIGAACRVLCSALQGASPDSRLAAGAREQNYAVLSPKLDEVYGQYSFSRDHP